ncbi:hypothetical protein BRADI_3g38132v3 [Brachypodium distachyon]|uniref:CCHC-type domain-containing protein n=1 Tax=Brachypodium distachyon TaxID=15368 RepID=A0A2K2D1Y9_BRADI|nr:hypothetical protein BRADI_3g38132v3 [Brachypodium distachyon]
MLRSDNGSCIHERIPSTPPAAATQAPPASPTTATHPANSPPPIRSSGSASWSTPARFSWADACEEEEGEFVPDSPLLRCGGRRSRSGWDMPPMFPRIGDPPFPCPLPRLPSMRRIRADLQLRKFDSLPLRLAPPLAGSQGSSMLVVPLPRAPHPSAAGCSLLRLLVARPRARPAFKPCLPALLPGPCAALMKAGRRSGHVAALEWTRLHSDATGLCVALAAPLDHRASTCREPLRCLECLGRGHRARVCPRRRPMPTPPPAPPARTSSPVAFGSRSWAAVVAAAPEEPAPTTPATPPLPASPRPGMASQGFGAPDTRPEEDTCIIPFSYDINRDMREWETTAAIAWVINAPRKLDALDVDRAIRKEFHISHADIVVMPHHPVQFLVKFANKAQFNEVLFKGTTTARGLTVRIRPYRPLKHAFATAMAFRVHLKLEKVIWVTFMGRSLDERADEILVTDYRPSGVKRDSSYRVIINLDTMEDYTAAPLDVTTCFHPRRLMVPPRPLSLLHRRSATTSTRGPGDTEAAEMTTRGFSLAAATTTTTIGVDAAPHPTPLDPGLQCLFDAQAKEIQAGLSAHAALAPALQAARADELRALLDQARAYLMRASAVAVQLLGLMPPPVSDPSPTPALAGNTPSLVNSAWFVQSATPVGCLSGAGTADLPDAFTGLAIAANPMPALLSPQATAIQNDDVAPAGFVLQTPATANQHDDAVQNDGAVEGAGDEVPDHCTLADFLTSIGKPAAPALLPSLAPVEKRAPPATPPRRSGRLATKKKGVFCSAAVQELLARVCSLINPSATFDDKSREAYVSLFKTPLSTPVIHAIETLVKQVKKMKTKPAAKKHKAAAPRCAQPADD